VAGPSQIKSKEKITVCKRCIYDESIPGISFDEEGVCSYRRQYDQLGEEYPSRRRRFGDEKYPSLHYRRRGSG